uniref:Easter-14 n=1 Tax=Nilaparvata lugens TaxID=108931 RepID=A0A068F588_NILLU|nr:easter-14 [Nilaparvata lugens]APA33883.1 seminal fluid protein [Nilaparvata lugens]
MASSFVLFLILPIHFIICSEFDPSAHRGWHLINDRKCGIRNQLKVFGGENAAIGEFPWAAQFITTKNKDSSSSMCTAAIISDQFVLLAAHCQPKEPYTSVVVAGNVDMNQDSDCGSRTNNCAPPKKTYQVERFFHPDDVFYKDIGLVKIKGRLKFNDFVAPICLEYGELLSKDYAGTEAEFAGWAAYKIDPVTNTTSGPSLLQKFTVPVQNESVCIESMHVIVRNTTSWQKDRKSFICAGSRPDQDISSEDSGGVLAVAQSVAGDIPRFFAVGVAAMHSEVPSIADVYTRVAYYMEWIMDTIANETV